MYPTTTAPSVLNERLPDPAVKILDPAFEKYRVLLASVERLSQGYSWAEGPVYLGDARCLLWSDIPNNRIMRWDEETGVTASTAGPRITPTATPATVRAGWSPPSTAGASRAPSTTAGPPC